MESLPPVNVCYLSPDKKTKHCFTLKTKYKASILSGRRRIKNDGSGRLNFLQPPHFRTAMEDELEDQIASRFKRAALVIGNSQLRKDERNILIFFIYFYSGQFIG